MTVSLARVRKHAMSLPEVTEQPHFDLLSWRVRGKIFATVPPEPQRLRLMLGEDEAHEALAELPDAVEELRWGRKLAGVTVRLDRVAAPDVDELVEVAWRRRAPKTLVREFDARLR
jgi:hypothetical protein